MIDNLFCEVKPERSRKELVCLFFRDPTSSPYAAVYAVISLCMVLGSTGVFIAESCPGLASEEVWFVLESVFIGFFTAEFIARWAVDPSPKTYPYRPMNVVDLLAIIPYYFELAVMTTVNLRFIRVVRLARVFRVFKLGKAFGGSDVLVAALKGSVSALTIPLFFLSIGLIVFSSVLHAIEQGTYDEESGKYFITDSSTGVRVEASGFKSIPETMWWALVTMTTVGYGDVSPRTAWGKVAACICMLFGILCMAMPIAIIGQNFVSAWESHEKCILPFSPAKKKPQHMAFPVLNFPAHLFSVSYKAAPTGTVHIQFSENVPVEIFDVLATIPLFGFVEWDGQHKGTLRARDPCIGIDCLVLNLLSFCKDNKCAVILATDCALYIDASGSDLLALRSP